MQSGQTLTSHYPEHGVVRRDPRELGERRLPVDRDVAGARRAPARGSAAGSAPGPPRPPRAARRPPVRRAAAAARRGRRSRPRCAPSSSGPEHRDEVGRAGLLHRDKGERHRPARDPARHLQGDDPGGSTRPRPAGPRAGSARGPAGSGGRLRRAIGRAVRWAEARSSVMTASMSARRTAGQRPRPRRRVRKATFMRIGRQQGGFWTSPRRAPAGSTARRGSGLAG